MKVLLDTHAFLWFINGDEKLTLNTRKLIEHLENEKFLSIASLWEIAIKKSLKKLEMDLLFPELVTNIAGVCQKTKLVENIDRCFPDQNENIHSLCWRSRLR